MIIKHLWPEILERPGVPIGAHAKDRLENYMHRQVCAGRMSLEQAQHDIATDWFGAYIRMEEAKDDKDEDGDGG